MKVRSWTDPLVVWPVAAWLAVAAILAAQGYHGLLGADAHEYLRTARQWTHLAHGGPRPVMAEHAMGYPLLGALIGGPFHMEPAALRLLTGLSWVLLISSVRSILSLHSTAATDAGPYALLAVGAAPFVMRYAHTVMSDVPAMAAVLASTAATLRWNARRRWRYIALAVLAAVLALCIRTACAPLLLVLALSWPRGLPAGRRAWPWALAGIIALFGAIAIAAGTDLPALGTPLQEWSVRHMPAREHRSDDGILRYALPNLLYVAGVIVHPGLLPMGLLLLPFVRRSDIGLPAVRLSLAMLAAYLLLLAGLPFQNDRVLCAGQPFAAIALFPAWQRALGWLRARGVRRGVAIGVCASVQMLLFARAMAPFVRQAHVEHDVAMHVRDLRPGMVYTHGMGGPLMEQVPGVPVQELWYGVLPRFAPGSLVVVQPASLQAQWSGLPPATNWSTALAQGARVLWRGPDGWVVAQVPGKGM